MISHLDATLSLSVGEARVFFDLLHERSQVASSQLPYIRRLEAEVFRFLADVEASRAAAAARGCAIATDPSGAGQCLGTVWMPWDGAPAGDLNVTITEAADRLGLSASYVRRMAPMWGGVKVAGRWLIPSDTLNTKARRSP
ncbi:MAG: hypothetical protein ABMA25_09660 [Ilumatobacteraceae bacterium]